VGLRSLAQVVLGILAFALFIEFWTALGNDGVDVGGAAVGAPLLLLLLVADVVVLVAISVFGRVGSPGSSGSGGTQTVVRANCSQCGWRAEAPTLTRARYLRQQHQHDAHDGRPPRP
jgi:hypothetical protein